MSSTPVPQDLAVLEHHVHAARDQLDFSAVRRVGMDETSARKGQDYVSLIPTGRNN
ncbi:MAG TPA: hypothetical protein VJT72_20020 [Pseudonocardiaceae bacterium]|nr:hypothetical protein [Pseudonocardiaceae bacterium]